MPTALSLLLRVIKNAIKKNKPKSSKGFDRKWS